MHILVQKCRLTERFKVLKNKLYSIIHSVYKHQISVINLWSNMNLEQAIAQATIDSNTSRKKIEEKSLSISPVLLQCMILPPLDLGIMFVLKQINYHFYCH